MLDELQTHARRSLLLTVLASVAACTDDANEGSFGRSDANARWNQPVDVRAKDPFPRTFTNLKGEHYEIPAPPQRIVSSTLFTDVVLSAICPKDRIAALHEVSTKPMFSPIAAESSRFPRHVSPDPETVRMFRPDLVFLASFSDKRSESLVTEKGCVVIRLHQLSSIAGVQQSIRNVGYVTGLDVAAEELVVSMQARLDAVARGKARRAKWRLLSFDSGFVAGKDTIFDDVLGYVGAANLAAVSGIEGTTRVDQEQLLTMRPDAVVIGVLPGREKEAKDRLLQLSGMRNLDSIKNDRIIYVSNPLMMSASHHVAGLAEAIAATLDRWEKP